MSHRGGTVTDPEPVFAGGNDTEIEGPSDRTFRSELG